MGGKKKLIRACQKGAIRKRSAISDQLSAKKEGNFHAVLKFQDALFMVRLSSIEGERPVNLLQEQHSGEAMG